MKKPIEIDLLGKISTDDFDRFLEYLESTEDFVWLSKTIRCRKYTLRGVPASVVDVLIDDNIDRWPNDPMVVELSKKTGKYDGQLRDRITIRRRQAHQVADIPHICLRCDLDASKLDVVIRLTIGAERREYATLRSDLNDYSLARIVMWHWRRYYIHLVDGDMIRAFADHWAIEQSESAQRWTLAEANRAASRALYRLSRDEGWRKLTLREREKYDIRSQWVRNEMYAAAVSKRIGNALGVGEYTLYVAHPEG